MNSKEIKEKIEEAKEIVGDDVQDPFAQIAFREVLRILLGQAGVGIVQQPPEIKDAKIRADMNIGELMAKLKVKNATERVTAMLYYHINNGITSTTRSEIYDLYSTIRQKKPGNLSDVIARCIRKGHIIEASEKKDKQKAWQITQTGERYIAELFVD